ncbi:hypothetical protein FACS1894125_3460 [Actinomycetota bacterium]|nr:hypothetical protein FACS1894125_3460 [Actinomycetota bacterium]
MTIDWHNFSELTRVQIPALVHLSRLGYDYLSAKSASFKAELDPETNILKGIFANSIRSINSDKNITDAEIDTILTNIRLELGNKVDLGKTFYERLVGVKNDIRLIDFENPDNNIYNICAELTYGNKDKDNFRTDLTVFVNGLPLVYIEVKKPNNTEGMKAEKDRFEDIRLKNEAFLKYNNITQFVIFSNNMEYNDEDHNSLEGVYYTTPAKPGRDGKVRTFFNHFREERSEEDNLADAITNLSTDVEQEILKDLNKVAIRTTLEYQTNLNSNSPTNRVLTSMLSKKRLLFLLKYGLTYVEKNDKEGNPLPMEKHIMRYPQLFATKAIEDTLNKDITKGIIWHTQGSGKTALAYYNQHFLTDYFAKSSANSRFYFIVDRLDLLNQAARVISKCKGKADFGMAA